MKNILYTASFLFMLINSPFIKAQERVSKINSIEIVELKGSGYERGYTHGKVLKESIANLYSKWKNSIRTETGKDPDSVIADFIKTSDYKAAILKWTPDLWEEIKGISDGSGQSFNDVFAFQLIDEYWGYLDRLEHGSVDKDHCSAIGLAAEGEHPTMVAQNIDIDTFMQGHQVVFHISGSKNEPEQYIVSSAGFIGFVGINNQGVGVVINALTDLNNSTSGLPVTFVTRGVLNRPSEKALEFVKNVKHATGQNYIIGFDSKVINLEASANEVVEFLPTNNPNIVYHTNHSINNHDIKPWMEEYHKRILSDTGAKTNSQMRYHILDKRLKSGPKGSRKDQLKEILRSKDDPRFPICVTYNENAIAFTFSSVLFVLGSSPYLEVTNGSPDVSDYQKIEF